MMKEMYETYKREEKWQEAAPTMKRTVFIRTREGHKSYKVQLDSRLSTGEWEARYLQQGFREPDTGIVIPAHSLQAVAVRDPGEAAPPDMLYPRELEPLAWLHEQVESVCALGLSA